MKKLPPILNVYILIFVNFKYDESANYIEHVWFDSEILIAANDSGEISVIRNGEFHEKIVNPFIIKGEEPKDDDSLPAISALCAFRKGFITGSPNGELAIWVKTSKEYTKEDE